MDELPGVGPDQIQLISKEGRFAQNLAERALPLLGGGIDNRFGSAHEIFAYGTPDKRKPYVYALHFGFEDNDRFSIEHGITPIGEDKTVDREYFFRKRRKHPTTIASPIPDPDRERIRSSWSNTNSDLALLKIRLFLEGITVTPAFLQQLVGWHEKEDRPLTVEEFIATNLPRAAESLGVDPAKNLGPYPAFVFTKPYFMTPETVRKLMLTRHAQNPENEKLLIDTQLGLLESDRFRINKRAFRQTSGSGS